VPGIHVLLPSLVTKDVDGRDKPGHDGGNYASCPLGAGIRHQNNVSYRSFQSGFRR
jgi:hypothetical protein